MFQDLSVLIDDNLTFTDVSDSANDFNRDDTLIELVSAEDYIYIGLYKPFDRLYAELTTPNTNANTLALEYSNGSGFSAFTALQFQDQSLGFTRSGFVKWDRDAVKDTWVTQSVNSIDRFWVRIKPSADFSAGTSLRGLNVVFSDDNMLSLELRSVLQFKRQADASFIAYHAAARDEIVNMLQNRGGIKLSSINDYSNYSNWSKWDLLDIKEVENASKFLTLSKIFFQASDEIDDKWYQRYLDYKKDFGKAFERVRLTLDSDDDGVKDNDEKLRIQAARVTRI